MANIQPFQALRYNPEKIKNPSKVMAPPYDVMSPKEQLSFHKRHKNNVIHLDFGIEKKGDRKGYDKYSRAGAYLEQWRKDQVLVQDEIPAMYIAAHTFKTPTGQSKTFYGLFAALKVEEYKRKVVLPHEKTLSKPKNDRMNLTRATKANLQLYGLEWRKTQVLGD